MKKSWEQMSGWIEELHAPLGNLMGQLELRQEEMEPEVAAIVERMPPGAISVRQSATWESPRGEPTQNPPSRSNRIGP